MPMYNQQFGAYSAPQFGYSGYNAYNYAQQPTYQPQPQPQLQQPQPPTINGKIVENEEMVKVIEVPISSYGVFPKADMSAVYVKTWNNDGTTRITTFAPVATPQSSPTPNYQETLADIQKQIGELSRKIDAFKPVQKKRREELEDDE